jgi:hypothetical protein
MTERPLKDVAGHSQCWLVERAQGVGGAAGV